jgi:hypothetical protein
MDQLLPLRKNRKGGFGLAASGLPALPTADKDLAHTIERL